MTVLYINALLKIKHAGNEKLGDTYFFNSNVSIEIGSEEGDDRLRFLFWIDGVRLEGKWINGKCNRKN